MEYIRLGFMPRILSLLSLLAGTCFATAQDQPKAPPPSDSDKNPVHNLPIDPDKLADAVRDSYYHPDNLSSLECSVSFDWSGVMRALKVDDLPVERQKIIEGLKVRSHARRNQATEVTFNWSGGEPPEGKVRIEGGLKQLLSRFYQIYWPILASPAVPPGTSVENIEPLDDGGVKAHLSQGAGQTEITIDKDHLPTHYAVNNPAMNGTIEAHYTTSPKPVPGDLRRLTELDVSNLLGAKRNVEVILDYQPANGFYVPQHVTFNVVDVSSLGMDFSGCSATKGDASSDPKN